MKPITGAVTASKPISLSKAASILSKFISSDTCATAEISAYLARASAAFDELVDYHLRLKGKGGEKKKGHDLVESGNLDGSERSKKEIEHGKVEAFDVGGGEKVENGLDEKERRGKVGALGVEGGRERDGVEHHGKKHKKKGGVKVGPLVGDEKGNAKENGEYDGKKHKMKKVLEDGGEVREDGESKGKNLKKKGGGKVEAFDGECDEKRVKEQGGRVGALEKYGGEEESDRYNEKSRKVKREGKVGTAKGEKGKNEDHSEKSSHKKKKVEKEGTLDEIGVVKAENGVEDSLGKRRKKGSGDVGENLGRKEKKKRKHVEDGEGEVGRGEERHKKRRVEGK